jgi:WD40 repeat protein
VALAPDGKLVAIARTGIKPGIQLFDISSEPRLLWQNFFSSQSGGAQSVSFSDDGKYLVVLLGNGRIHRFDAAKGGSHMSIPSSGLVAAMVPQGKTVAVAEKNGELTLWRLSDGTIEWHLPPKHNLGMVSKLAVSSNGNRIATLEYSKDGAVIRIWQIHRRSMIAQIPVADKEISDIALNSDGSSLYISTIGQGLIKACINRSGTKFLKEIKKARGCTGKIKWISSARLLSCSVDNGIVWIDQSGKTVKKFITSMETTTLAVSVSEDGNTVAAVGNGHLLMW